MILRCIDLETTERGDPPVEEIVQVGWTDVTESVAEAGWAIEPYRPKDAERPGVAFPFESHLVNPGCPIAPQSSAIHNIIDDDVAGEPKAEEILGQAFFMPQETIYVAHFTDHEQKVLGGTRGFRWIDTWRVAVHLAPQAKSWKLRYLQYWLELDVDRQFALPNHQAGPDAYVCAALLMRMLGKLSVDEMLDISSRFAFLPRLGFGKHKDLPIQDVPSGYFDWILKERNPDGTFAFDKHVLYTAQRELTRRENER